MALFDNVFKLGTPALVGLGVLVLAPIVIPAVGTALKPLAKEALKSGLLLVSKGKELMAEAAESLADIADEVRAELIAEQKSPTGTAGPE